ncbi:hypothetical protein [Salinibacterium sp. SWN1162]|uniref:hypothetical protein n=1 Tax=Salinibacterium sp. SWN1162 TaxID=2792053 RepID=UPI0018CED737|nr:hypothetical protein [Salinibacterium sp. SWN1162]MBH0009783.1 hypothetical protein [Salinibacterium sp. SWN1162]
MRAAPLPSASSPRLRRWLTGAAALAIALMTIVPAAEASASTGSIPPDVSAFATDDDGLLQSLEEFFGVDQRGTGLDFSEGIELGEIDRVFLWSQDFHSGIATDTPVQYVNRWKVPVMIGDEPVGVALIGFDPATVEPEMIDFIRSPGTALALDDVDSDATLIHEPETGAWFSLVDGVITPLVRGSSEVAGETSLTAYQPIVSSRVITVVDETPQPNRGAVQSVVLIVTTVIVVLLALLVPTILGKRSERRERRAEAEAEAGAGDSQIASVVTNAAPVAVEADADADADAEAEADADAGPEAGEATVAVEQERPATTPAPAKATVKKTPTPRSPAAKKTPAAKKPAAKKPAAKKPAAKKPAAKKPTALKTSPAAPPSPDASDSSAAQ